MGYQRYGADEWQLAPWEFKVATGFENRFSSGVRFGLNETITQSAFQDIWNVGSNLTYLTSPEILNIVSTSTSDTAAGTGAQSIIVTGLDGNYDQIQETVILNGTTIVTTSNSYLRVTTLRVDDIGSGGMNAGTITAKTTTPTSTQAQISVDLGLSSGAFLTVPNGFFGIVTFLTASIVGADAATFDFQIRFPGKGFIVGFREHIPAGGFNELDFMRFKAPQPIPPRTDVKVRAIRDTGGNAASVAASLGFYLIDQREIKL